MKDNIFTWIIKCKSAIQIHILHYWIAFSPYEMIFWNYRLCTCISDCLFAFKTWEMKFDIHITLQLGTTKFNFLTKFLTFSWLFSSFNKMSWFSRLFLTALKTILIFLIFPDHMNSVFCLEGALLGLKTAHVEPNKTVYVKDIAWYKNITKENPAQVWSSCIFKLLLLYYSLSFIKLD